MVHGSPGGGADERIGQGPSAKEGEFGDECEPKSNRTGRGFFSCPRVDGASPRSTDLLQFKEKKTGQSNTVKTRFFGGRIPAPIRHNMLEMLDRSLTKF